MNDAHRQSRHLLDLLVRGAGYLDANFVHQFSAAFHRLPRLHADLGADFVRSEEVREVAQAMLRLLEARVAGSGAQAGREVDLVAQLREALRETQSPDDRDSR